MSENQPYLLVAETAAIQDYVFRSNRLRENQGGSQLIYEITRQMPEDLHRHMVAEDLLTASPSLLFAGGGGFAYQFNTRNDAVTFERALKWQFMQRAPGLHFFSYIQRPDETQSRREQIDAAYYALSQIKNVRNAPYLLMGTAITRPCRTSGVPAQDFSRAGGDAASKSVEASQEVIARHLSVKQARIRLTTSLTNLDQETFCFPSSIEDLGQSIGESNYVAVVHADGNRIGALRRKMGRAADDHQNVADLQAFSENLNKASEEALNRVLADLQTAAKDGVIEEDGLNSPILLDLGRKKEDKHRLMLPFLPLVFGGDDVTFIADSRLGLWLATKYLRAFEEEVNDRIKLPNEHITASAGVAIVRTHYPFSRAYQLADALCQHAKRQYQDNPGSWIDWHVARPNLLGTLQSIRTREYTSSTGDHLTVRPIRLDGRANVAFSQAPYRNWNQVLEGRRDFKKNSRWTATKIQDFKTSLEHGPNEVEAFVRSFPKGSPLPMLSDLEQSIAENLVQKGFHINHCYYYDALETLNMYLPED